MGLETKCTVTCVTLFTLNQGVEVLFRGKKNVLESLHSFTFGLHLSTKSLHRACLNSLISLHLVYIQGPNGCKKQVERKSLTHSALLAFYANYHLKHFVFSSMCHKLWVEFFVSLLLTIRHVVLSAIRTHIFVLPAIIPSLAEALGHPAGINGVCLQFELIHGKDRCNERIHFLPYETLHKMLQ